MAPALFGSLYGDLSYHWEHRTAPQKGLNNRSHAIISGKGLGGGSAVNFLVWTHANRRDIDDWGALGNRGWSWDRLQPYYQKSETFVKPSSQQVVDLNLSFLDPPVHGHHGPIMNSFPSLYGPISEAWPRTFENLGLGATGDPRGGKTTGGFSNPFNIDPATKERSYPGSRYYQLATTRRNLKVITGALVTKVHLDKNKRGVPTATGVRYEKDGIQYKANTRKEVIISLGGLASPKLLELSGIGDQKLLKRLGIKTLVHNPNVGENYQNHIMVPLGGIPPRPLAFQSALTQFLTTKTGPLTVINASSALLTLSQLNLKIPPLVPPKTKQQTLIHSSLTSSSNPSPAVQILFVAGGMTPWLYNDTSRAYASPPGTTPQDRYITIHGLLQRPFSCGSVHIQSSNPHILPTVDTQDLTHPLDIQITKAFMLQIQKIASTRPFSEYLEGNGTVFQPGYYKLNERNVEGFIREFAFLASHFSGTCAMMPRGEGGVVDERFRVYGIKGLRVVDASIFPLIPQATLNSAVIAVAERAGDMIKGDYEF
ncbi:oxygen-dependent choline dehydrogenase [Podospora fimiseda]|uniref:Oxygen-dependent choline dehydrogenase n=1 Tax=Podospora fimiseda TaxID=252190 RepID=A0AAN7GWC6_9PEZI|nr:oxygen-dependent choline dehydrogenase [Podospora fimiseda]